MKVYVALAGEYEIASPLGVFESEEKARKCVTDSKPTYNTKIEVFETETGERIDMIYVDAV